jgi:DNA-binding MarR family transcriptional regulator
MDEGRRLRHQVCFALYAASRAVTGRYRPILDKIGLTYPQYIAMLVLWEHDEVSVKELGDTLQLDSGTLSPLIKRLETAGLVTRQRSSTDERSVIVSLTTAGRQMRADAAHIPAELARATGMSQAELTAMRDTLTELTERLKDE